MAAQRIFRGALSLSRLRRIASCRPSALDFAFRFAAVPATLHFAAGSLDYDAGDRHLRFLRQRFYRCGDFRLKI
jgi:hypothetical protein